MGVGGGGGVRFPPWRVNPATKLLSHALNLTELNPAPRKQRMTAYVVGRTGTGIEAQRADSEQDVTALVCHGLWF